MVWTPADTVSKEYFPSEVVTEIPIVFPFESVNVTVRAETKDVFCSSNFPSPLTSYQIVP